MTRKSLLSYREAARSRSSLQMSKKLEARRAFGRLQASFQNEMEIITSRSNARRGTPLTRHELGINIARSRHQRRFGVIGHSCTTGREKMPRTAHNLQPLSWQSM